MGEEDTLNWTLGDHLGSASVTTTANGTWYSELRYSAFGEMRYSSGITPTDYRYTGQLEQADVNLYYYNARWYDPALGRFIQADTIIPGPGDSKSYDRYSYVNNNPVRYTDPSGHGVPFGVCEIAGGSIPQCQKQGGSPANMPKYAPATPKTLWVIVCGTAYSCSGDQSGQNPSFGLPAYPGWKNQLEKHVGYQVTFVETPEEGRYSGYDIGEYAKSIEETISESDADIINFICHSRGGQTCTHLLRTLDDDRIDETYMIEPSVRDKKDLDTGYFDTVEDYNLLSSDEEKYKITLLVSGDDTRYSPPYGAVPDYTYTDLYSTDKHNELVYTLEVIQWIMRDYATRD
jgi:RHS repeat-associated protein